MQTILLVDSNQDYRHMVAMIVRRVGYDVIQADNGADAMEKALSERPDLIMMEHTPPAMNGVEMATSLKSNLFTFDIPVVIYTTREAKNEALCGGAANVLTKPISSTEVGQVLHKHLTKSRNRPRAIPSPRMESSAKAALSIRHVIP